jgi:hypothetical protein
VRDPRHKTLSRTGVLPSAPVSNGPYQQTSGGINVSNKIQQLNLAELDSVVGGVIIPCPFGYSVYVTQGTMYGHDYVAGNIIGPNGPGQKGVADILN